MFVVFAKANTNTGCLFGKDSPKKNAKGEPVVEGISSELVEAMKTNLRTIPGVKWQYYGNKDGVMYSFPAKSSCHRASYDPRLRLVSCRIEVRPSHRLHNYKKCRFARHRSVAV